MLYTNLKHIETDKQQQQVVAENENVVIICGRMEPASILLYRVAAGLEKKYPQVAFYDMEFDNPETTVLKHALEDCNLTNIPLTGYFKNGYLVNVTFGVQTSQQMIDLIEKELLQIVSY